MVQTLYIVNGTEEFFLRRIKNWHRLGIVEIAVRILGLVKRILDG